MISNISWCYSQSITTDPLAGKALDVLRTDRIAHSLWTREEIKEHKSLNKEQKKAIEDALMNCFQLIQGPPGQCSNSSLFAYSCVTHYMLLSRLPYEFLSFHKFSYRYR